MLISDFAIKRPIVTVTAMVALVVFGIFALLQLDTDEFPDVQEPIVITSIVYPGAAPDVVEREVVEPIEEAISGISGVSKVRSKASDGFAVITAEFNFSKDLGDATQEIRDKISEIRSDLPGEIEEPVLSKFSDTDIPVFSITLSSKTLNSAELTRLADPGITRELRGLPGVAQVSVVGEIERELTVELRPDALRAAGVSVGEVVQALQLQNLAVPVGRVSGSLDERTIRLKGRILEPSDFAHLVVSERNGSIIRLGQLATVRDGTEEPRTLALYNGREAIGLDIRKSKGYSTTAVSEAVRGRIEDIRAKLPAGVLLDVVQDAGERVDLSVSNVQEALIEGAALTVLVVFLFLNSWRSTVITGLALPVSVLASFIAVWAFGFTLNTMSLMGLSLAIGILIDDAIVVRENIVRHIEMGKDHFTASREGTDEIGLAVAATTFSIVAVFVPIGFMGGVGGQWFKPFALTIACSVLVSLFVSFSLDPMLSAYWADPQIEAHERRNPIARALDRFNSWFDRQAKNYRRVIGWALDHRAAMVFLAVGSFVGAIALQVAYGGGGFMPDMDQSEVLIKIETPPGSNLDYTRIKSEEAGVITRAHEDVVRYTYTTIGGASGEVDAAQIYVRLKKKNERDINQGEFAQKLRREVAGIGGATVSVFSGSWGGGVKQIQIELRGDDAQTLAQLADRLSAEVRSVPGVVDVGLSTKGQRPELNVELNRGVAGSLGVTVGQVAQSLRPAFAGIDAGDWVDPQGETRDVVVRLAPESRRRAADLEQLPLVVRGADGGATTLPLGQIASIEQSIGPAQIDHLDRTKVVAVQANTFGRSLNEVLPDVQKKVDAIQLPPGYRVSMGGEVEDQAEVFGQIFAALGAAVLLMYLILVMQFGSFLDPLAILLSLPLSLIGVVLALLITGDTLNIMSMIGVILLMGIVAKNAILLIDFAKWSRERDGLPLREALIEAGAIRLRPILMTTFALIAGMMPVAIGAGEGADFRAPLGRAVIGGVITSTFLTLLVIPTFYEIMDEWRAKAGRVFGVKTKQRTAEHRVVTPVAQSGD